MESLFPVDNDNLQQPASSPPEKSRHDYVNVNDCVANSKVPAMPKYVNMGPFLNDLAAQRCTRDKTSEQVDLQKL